MSIRKLTSLFKILFFTDLPIASDYLILVKISENVTEFQRFLF